MRDEFSYPPLLSSDSQGMSQGGSTTFQRIQRRKTKDGSSRRGRFEFDDRYWSYPACTNDAYVQFGRPRFLALLILSSKEKIRRMSFLANGSASKKPEDVRPRTTC